MAKPQIPSSERVVRNAIRNCQPDFPTRGYFRGGHTSLSEAFAYHRINEVLVASWIAKFNFPVHQAYVLADD
jgi:hypothetical protein